MHKLVKLEKNYDVTFANEPKEFLASDNVYIPVKKGYLVLVKNNEYVLKGQIIAENNLNKILSSVSGKVVGTTEKNVDGINTKCIVIENDFKEKEKKVTKRKDTKFTKDIIVSKLYEFYFKYYASVLESKKINNLVIITYDDEPYVENNFFITKTYIKEILDMIDLLSTTFEIKNSYIMMKSNHTTIIENYLSKIGTYPNISISLVEDKYLLGKPYFLLESMNLNNFDSLCIDVKDLIEMYNAIKYDKVVNDVFISVSGPNINKSYVIKTKIGCPLSDAISFGKVEDSSDYILNGLMTGSSCDPKDVVISKYTKGVVIIPKNEVKESKCNLCGMCYKICPVKVNPKKVMDQRKISTNCIDCGLCTYICPCNINLRRFLRGEHE